MDAAEALREGRKLAAAEVCWLLLARLVLLPVNAAPAAALLLGAIVPALLLVSGSCGSERSLTSE